MRARRAARLAAAPKQSPLMLIPIVLRRMPRALAAAFASLVRSEISLLSYSATAARIWIAALRERRSSRAMARTAR